MERKPLSQERLVNIEQKYDTIIQKYAEARPNIRSFFGPMYDRDLDRDTDRLSYKQIAVAARYDRRPEQEDEEKDDKALEGVIYYMGQHGQLFNTPHYAEASCDFDDLFNGADVCLGLPNPSHHDIVLSIDACSATDRRAVAEKFAKSDSYTTVPGCSYLKYYRHDRRQARIPFTPHYILGANPAEIQRAVAGFDISNPSSISNEVDEDLRRKLLIELAYQSSCHRMTCENAIAEGRTQLPNRNDGPMRFQEAMAAHEKVLHESLAALRQSFGVERGDLTKAIDKFFDRSDDPTFREIVTQSRARLVPQGQKRRARRAQRSAAISRGTQPTPPITYKENTAQTDTEQQTPAAQTDSHPAA